MSEIQSVPGLEVFHSDSLLWDLVLTALSAVHGCGLRWPEVLGSDVPPFSHRYAIPPEHGKRLERLAIGRYLSPGGTRTKMKWAGGPSR